MDKFLIVQQLEELNKALQKIEQELTKGGYVWNEKDCETIKQQTKKITNKATNINLSVFQNYCKNKYTI